MFETILECLLNAKKGDLKLILGSGRSGESVFDTYLRKKYDKISFTTHRMQKEARVIFLSNRYVESFQFH